MKLTIIVDDSCVYVNGINKGILVLSSCDIPANIHALQWKDSAGWIEFKENDNGTKPANKIINELPAWANNCLKVWEEFVPNLPELKTQSIQSTTL